MFATFWPRYSMLSPRVCHARVMSLPGSGHGLATWLACCCQVIATLLKFGCHLLAMLLQCPGYVLATLLQLCCNDIANDIATPWLSRHFDALATFLSRRCHAVAMFGPRALPRLRRNVLATALPRVLFHAVATLLQCYEHVHATSLQRRCHDIATMFPRPVRGHRPRP